MSYVKMCKRFLSTKVENREITEQKTDLLDEFP